MYIHTYIYTYIHVYIYIYIYVYVYTYIYIYIYIYMCIYIYIYIYTHIYTYTRHLQARARACMHTPPPGGSRHGASAGAHPSPPPPFSQRRCVREMLQIPSSAERGNPLLDKTRQHETLQPDTCRGDDFFLFCRGCAKRLKRSRIGRPCDYPQAIWGTTTVNPQRVAALLLLLCYGIVLVVVYVCFIAIIVEPLLLWSLLLYVFLPNSTIAVNPRNNNPQTKTR